MIRWVHKKLLNYDTLKFLSSFPVPYLLCVSVDPLSVDLCVPWEERVIDGSSLMLC